MNHRERVLCTLNHKEPDRVPICIGGSGQKFSRRIYNAVKKKLGINEKFEYEDRYEEFGNIVNYNPQLLDYFNVDFRYIHINRIPLEYNAIDDSWEHELGFRLKYIGDNETRNIVFFPLRNADFEEIKKYRFPDSYDKRRVVGLKEKAKFLHENTDYAIVSYKASMAGIFDLACIMRGYDNFFMDLMADKRLANLLLDKILEFNYGVYELFLREVGNYVDIVEFNDDLGTQQNLMISPALYREFFKERHKILIEMFRKYAPKANIFLHSCGSVYDIIPDFIEIGIDILNPIQPLASKMDSFKLKKEFGKYICFQGGIDIQKAIKGTIEDLKNEIKLRIKTLAPGGGYIMSTANNILGDVPLENIFKLYEFAKLYGIYPIKV